jgi:hypothetical protein
VLGQNSANHVLVDLDAEGSPDDERNLRTAEPWIALLEFDDHPDEILRWSFGTWLTLLVR